ncbi:DUF6520 family protein [Sinomicrobium kalidii]|uniref:DUF6520 family protein n=1 Tax=Sinomicrobium kalidii TaxID=2900738 RepID=UPI001E3887E5|nr:DUF6520 family protein [Sinomicrobium kalidii]UGU15318.1 DUF6520 family protein [Sinomicrobium kalidii]
MKRYKILLSGVAFILAIAATFATAQVVRMPGVPNHYKKGNQCLQCTIPNEPGDVYNINYFCDTLKGTSSLRCTCIDIDKSVRAATLDDPIACTPLWRHELL